MRSSTGLGSPCDESPAEASTPASTRACAWARAAPGLDPRQAAGHLPGSGFDRIAFEGLAARRRAHQIHELGDAGILGGRIPATHRRRVADQDLRRAVPRRRQGEPVGETLLGDDEHGNALVERRGLAAGVRRPRGREVEIAGRGIVLDPQPARDTDHLLHPIIAERDAADLAGGDPGRELRVVGRLQDLHRRGRRRRARIYLECGERRGDLALRPPGPLAVERNQMFAIPVPRPRPAGGAGALTSLHRSPLRA